MKLPLDRMTNGLSPDQDLFFPECPADPDMRESASMWLFDENGEIALPRVGIEAEAKSWDPRGYQLNVVLGGGRILQGRGSGAAHDPKGPDGRPTVLGAGPLAFRCIEPFRRWAVRYDGTAIDGTAQQQIGRTLDPENEIPVRIDVEMEMATPAWVHDNSPENLAKMSEAQRAEAMSMGIGWRLEHTFRGAGTLAVDGEERSFRCTGSRIKRQSVRPLMNFRGHVWQSALFPDGRAFGFITYPPKGDGSEPFTDGYVYQDGKMYPARATGIPWLRDLVDAGDDVSLELTSELGTTRIEAATTGSTFMVMGRSDGLPFDFNLQQGGARYTWDGQTAYGMIERSKSDAAPDAG